MVSEICRVAFYVFDSVYWLMDIRILSSNFSIWRSFFAQQKAEKLTFLLLQECKSFSFFSFHLSQYQQKKGMLWVLTWMWSCKVIMLGYQSVFNLTFWSFSSFLTQYKFISLRINNENVTKILLTVKPLENVKAWKAAWISNFM